ncbi:uncharacterized protein LOC134842901 isoform X4 [Symsagittifera roscoffensis]|uniref:uncharacterized protein LOC134842901 isoform X4 n=1 Tax=Symsagittifera roscoffensis TaxID=84072 RepID=UPI00307C51EC
MLLKMENSIFEEVCKMKLSHEDKEQLFVSIMQSMASQHHRANNIKSSKQSLTNLESAPRKQNNFKPSFQNQFSLAEASVDQPNGYDGDPHPNGFDSKNLKSTSNNEQFVTGTQSHLQNHQNHRSYNTSANHQQFAPGQTQGQGHASDIQSSVKTEQNYLFVQPNFSEHFAAGPILDSGDVRARLSGQEGGVNVEAAAASFFAKATQKVAKQAKTRNPISTTANPSSNFLTNSGHTIMSPNQTKQDSDHPFETNFGLTLTKTPPSAPPGLFRNVDRRTSTAGKLKVALRLSPENKEGIASANSFVSVDDRRKQILLKDPRPNSQTTETSVANTVAAPPKMFAFDHVFAEDAAQAEICASTLPEVLQSVINGNDGCVFGFGNANLGKTFTMVGEDTSLQTIGVVPCAISWLFRLINDQKQKSGAKFSVRVSSVEIYGKDEHVKDLLADQDTGGSFFSSAHESPGMLLQPRDASGNFSLQNHSELRAASADKAAFYLDAALAARTCNISKEFTSDNEYQPSHMIFTLHIYQYRVDKTKKTGVCGGRSRLHLIDLGNCERLTSLPGSPTTPGSFLSYNALSNVLLALMNGSRHVPHRDSKLTQLLRDIMGGGSCCTVMIAHVSCQPQGYEDTLATVQLAHKLHRTKKRKAKASFGASGLRHHSSGAASSSSEYSENSSCDELGRPRRRTTTGNPGSLKQSIQGTMQTVNEQSYMSSDYSSSSEQSCDTVIYRGPDGRMLSDNELTDNERPPQFSRVVTSTNPSALERINRPSNMFKPIKEFSEENDLNKSGVASRTHSDSEVSTRNPSFKMASKNRYSPKQCSTPAESDQEGVFVISRPLNVGARRSNSVGEDSKCASIPENPSTVTPTMNNQPKCESSGSICSACNVAYENSLMFQAQYNNNQTSCNSAKCKHYSTASDSSFENLPGMLGVMNNQNHSTSPIRGVVSDTEVLYNAPRSIKDAVVKPKTGSNLSFISEETDPAVQSQTSAGNKQTRFALSANSLAQNAVKNLKPVFVKESKPASKKSLSTASFFKEPPAVDDVWQIRTSPKDSCKDSYPVRVHCGMSDGKRMQSTAMLVALGPQASKMCVQCSTGRSCFRDHSTPRTPQIVSQLSACSSVGSTPQSVMPNVNHVTINTPKSTPSRKTSLLSRLRRSRTPDQTPKMKSKRFSRDQKNSSRSSQPSPSRKSKIKIPVLENLQNRTPENSPPRGRKVSMPKVSISSQSSYESSNECDFSGFQTHMPRYAFSDSEEMFCSQKSDSSSIPSQNGYQPMQGCHNSIPSSHQSSFGEITATKTYPDFNRIVADIQRDSLTVPQLAGNTHQYETLDRVNNSSQANQSIAYPDKQVLIQKFADARASKCHIATHPLYRLSSYTADSGLESMSGGGATGSPRCHPDVIESHCPPTGPCGHQHRSRCQYVASCSCHSQNLTPQSSASYETTPNEERMLYPISSQLSNINSIETSKTSDLNSVPCSPFTCSKDLKGRPKRSKSADRKSSGRKSIFASMFSLRSRKSKAEASSASQSSSCKRGNILSDSAPSERRISIINQTPQIKPTAVVARVPPVQRLQPPVVSPGSGITVTTDSDSGIELNSNGQRRHQRQCHGNSAEAMCNSIPTVTPRCCNEAAIMPNSSSDCSQNGQVNRRPVSSSGSGSRGRHTQREPCSNPERCRNIKKKLLYGPSVEIHNAAISGTTIQTCAKCNNLKEYWVDSPCEQEPTRPAPAFIPEEEVDLILEKLGPNQMSQDVTATEFDISTAYTHNSQRESIAGRGTPESTSDTPPVALPDPNLHQSLDKTSGTTTSGIIKETSATGVSSRTSVQPEHNVAHGDSRVRCRPSCPSPQLPPPDIHACVHNCQGRNQFTSDTKDKAGQGCDNNATQHDLASDCNSFERKAGQNCDNDDKIYFEREQFKHDNPRLADVDLLQFDWPVPKNTRRLGSAV